MKTSRAFMFSMEAAFALTLVIVAAAYLPAFTPQKENAGEFLACSDVAGVLAKARAFSSQEALNASVGEAGQLSGACIEADGAGLNASSCQGKGTGGGEKYSFSFPVWKEGKVQTARVGCYLAGSG